MLHGGQFLPDYLLVTGTTASATDQQEEQFTITAAFLDPHETSMDSATILYESQLPQILQTCDRLADIRLLNRWKEGNSPTYRDEARERAKAIMDQFLHANKRE